MNVLVIGSGGREHALVWKLKQSPQVTNLYCAPGNGGIAELATCVDIKADDIDRLAAFAAREKIDLTVVGPEGPLAEGVVDLFRQKKLRIFGPSRLASRLEASKSFAKHIMTKYNIPTASYREFNDYDEAIAYVRGQNAAQVIKADGLCGGKGVFVADTLREQEQALDAILKQRVFKAAGSSVVIEEKLVGEEASILVLCDGEAMVPLPASQDHKQVFDDDQGPNTGGMGAYSPAPIITPAMAVRIERDIIAPAIRGMRAEGCPYQGVLYAGLMITSQGPKVLEFNVRFGDPETQAILPRLQTDLYEVLCATADSRLAGVSLAWDTRACVCVVLVAGGYPDRYQKGKIINGLERVKKLSDVMVFHAGTRKNKTGALLTDGGRVLGVTGLGAGISGAIARTYEACKMITFSGMHMRTDIGGKALAHYRATAKKVTV